MADSHTPPNGTPAIRTATTADLDRLWSAIRDGLADNREHLGGLICAADAGSIARDAALEKRVDRLFALDRQKDSELSGLQDRILGTAKTAAGGSAIAQAALDVAARGSAEVQVTRAAVEQIAAQVCGRKVPQWVAIAAGLIVAVASAVAQVSR